ACEMVDRKPGCSVSAAVLFRLFGLAAVNSPATCHREVMCLGAPIVSGHAACECHLASQVPKVQAAKALDKPQASSSVEGLLAAAVSATGEAPNRAVKRRVRQRLHKKLGAVLNKEEFERAMECFHTAAEAQRREEGLRAPKRGAPALPSRAVGQQAKAAPSFVAVPVVMVPSMDARTQMPQMPQMPMTMPQGWNVPVVCAVQETSSRFKSERECPKWLPCHTACPIRAAALGRMASTQLRSRTVDSLAATFPFSVRDLKETSLLHIQEVTTCRWSGPSSSSPPTETVASAPQGLLMDVQHREPPQWSHPKANRP
ncbi:unnamed protein product, partial [Effrenium voratum]